MKQVGSLGKTLHSTSDAAVVPTVASRISFESFHQAWLSLMPVTPSNALDIGADCVRDADWLANRGWLVTAVAPEKQTIKQARPDSHPSVNWRVDNLPELKNIHGEFSLILLNAALMELTIADQVAALRRATELLSHQGLLVITFTQHQTSGYPVREFLLLDEATSCGLKSILHTGRESENFGLAGWQTLVFEKT